MRSLGLALRSSLLAALVCAASACNLDGDVDHDGDYTFLPGAPRPDTAPRELRSLLLVEADAKHAARRFYYFTGELGPLGLGIESLPHLLAREGRFSLLFENPFNAYDAMEPSAEPAAPEDPADPRERPGVSAPLLEVDGAPLVLEPLTSARLSAVGASRFIGVLESGAFSAEAFIGREATAEPWSLIRITEPPLDPLALTGELAVSEPAVSREEGGLALDPGAHAPPNYTVIDLYQDVTHHADARQLEAVLRISVAPETRYVATAEALSSAFDALCWSKEAPLFARVTQVVRRLAGPALDRALIARHADTLELPKDVWTDLVTVGETPAYCADYR